MARGQNGDTLPLLSFFMLLDLIAGARPNFVKLAPVIRAVEEASSAGRKISYRFIHTGQHNSEEMSAAMLRDLRMPAPHIELGCTGDSRGAMLASVIEKYDAVLRDEKPDWTVVVGDVTSTLGAALAAKAADVHVAHVEAGLRSGDRTMPEELNRIATDAVADLHFTTSLGAGEHLLREGIAKERIHFAGNTMADALFQILPHVQRPRVFEELTLSPERYCLLTLHRPANVDDAVILHQWLDAVGDACHDMPVVFPAHPRTITSLKTSAAVPSNIRVVTPLPYASSIYLQQHAGIIITDSGGMSEETTILRRPCVTLRTTTERPETVAEGTNVLAFTSMDIVPAVAAARAKAASPKPLPALWDGRASQRIVNGLLAW